MLNMNVATTANTAVAAPSAFASAPMTMEALLGINMKDARILDGLQVWPAGKYQMVFLGLDQAEYDIRQEEHAFVGQKGLKITAKFKSVRGVGLKGTDGKAMTLEAAAEWNDKDFEEGILFGNDGLPSKKDPSVPAYPGRDKLATLIERMVGKDKWPAYLEATGGDLLKMVGPMIGKTVAFEIGHNINPNDPNKRVQHQLNIFGEFVPMEALI